MTAFHARVYGLIVAADAPIDGVLPIPPEPPDVAITLRERSTLRAESSPDMLTLDYPDGTHFEIARDARAIHGEWEPHSTPQDTATYLLGPVLAYVLRLRGTLALHASAVVVRDKAVLIAGAPGAGKSTTAAAFARRGAVVITDDVAAIENGCVHPGYPRLRLWSDVAAAMWGSADALPLLTPTWTKRFASTPNFASRAYAIGAVFVIVDRAPQASLRRLHGHEAAITLLRHASMTHALDASMRERELSQVTQLASEVPVFAATAPDDLHRVDELCAVIADA